MDKLNWNKIRSGDKQAFRLLFDEYYSPLCLYANSIVGDLGLSQDLVSDCFVRIWERKETIDIKSSLKNYLLLAVRNNIYSYLRSPESRKSNIGSMIERLENTPVEEYDLEKEETLQQVYDLIDELPEQRKKILELACFKRKTYKEIAEILGISVNTVNTQMSRAYRFLRDRLHANDFFLWFFFQKIKTIHESRASHTGA
jgi:RNA polymerase sigma-70 factor (ECF subfamily)